MNILHLEASPGWGGQEIRVLREAEGMRERGHRVTLAVMTGGKLIEKAREKGFTVYELNFKRGSWLLVFIKLLRIFKKHEIELVNTHSSLDAWIGGIAARFARKKIVRTRHLSTVIRSGWNSRMIYGKFADFVVTTCTPIIPMICSQSGKAPNKCRAVATGVNPELIQFDPKQVRQFRNDLGLKPKDVLVGMVCFMRSWKGIHDLLKAADHLRDHKDLKWVIIGGGHEEEYRAKAKELKLEGIVHFTGHLDNPFHAMQALDIFILLSTAHEGISQAILQAAYLGKPLIATATGGLGEVCIDRMTGIRVPPISYQSVVDAVLELKESSALREQYGEAAHRLVKERFTLKHTLDAMEEVYSQIVG